MMARFILTVQRLVNSTDTLIKNGDIAVDSGGRYVHIIDDEELLQQAYISVAAKLGNFVYNRELGSELYKGNINDENYAEKINLIMSQTLVDYPQVKAEVVAVRKPKIRIKLSCKDSVREEIINIDDYI